MGPLELAWDHSGEASLQSEDWVLGPLELAWDHSGEALLLPFNNSRRNKFRAPLGLACDNCGEASLLPFENNQKIWFCDFWG